jgi:predicted Zn-dependent protease
MNERPPIRTANPGDRDPIWQEGVRRQEIRSKFLVPLYVMWASDVPSNIADAAVEGVRDAMIASGQDRGLAILGSDTFLPGDFSNADWYVREASRRQDLVRNAGYGNQLDAGQFAGLFRDEPWQVEPHWEVLIVNQDLNCRVGDSYINFVFGVTNPIFAYSVQSARRLTAGVRDLDLQKELVRRVLRHEVGHMFGLPMRNENTTENLGKHCTNICTMRQGLSTQEWSNQWREETDRGVQFCGNCLSDLAQSKNYYKSLSELPERLKRSV